MDACFESVVSDWQLSPHALAAVSDTLALTVRPVSVVG